MYTCKHVSYALLHNVGHTFKLAQNSKDGDVYLFQYLPDAQIHLQLTLLSSGEPCVHETPQPTKPTLHIYIYLSAHNTNSEHGINGKD
jgi:hypothetical protein